jgi:D-alanine-D-alanine ligase
MENKKINVGILFGGKSAEHEISLQSAKNVIEAIDKSKYDVTLIGITKNGNWLLNEETSILLNANDSNNISLNLDSDDVAMIPQSQGNISNFSNATFNKSVDVVFPILHGPFGDDGTIQGLLKLANIPFVGAGVLGSAIGMDKDIMKRLLRDASLPIGKFITLHSSDNIPSYDSVIDQIGYPVFIKPANLGSSVGINKASDESSFQKAVKEAFEFDSKVIIEAFIDGREIECAVLGNENPKASTCGEISFTHDFYSYEAKYLDDGGFKIDIPAQLPADIQIEIQKLAIRTFQTLACKGFARVDFFLTKDNEILVNEINTIPGFTKISMYPKLWEASGIPYADLIDQLIQLAIEIFDKEKGIKTSR